MRSADGVIGGDGNARDFPGANRLAMNGSGPQVSGDWITLSCWAQADVSAANLNLVARWDGAAATNSYLLSGPPVGLQVGDGIGGGATVSGSTTYANGGPRLHHFCGTKGPNGMEVWIDGKLDGTTSSTESLVNAGTACIGDASLSLPYDGVIRQVAIWDEQLSPWDVRGSKLRVWIPLSSWGGGTGDARDLSTFGQAATPAGGTTYTARPGQSPQPLNPLRILLTQLSDLQFVAGEVRSLSV